MAAQQGVCVDVYKLTVIHPLPQGLCDALGGYRSILFAEEGVRGGGIGEHLAAALLERGCNASYRHIAVPNNGLTHASVDELRARFGLDAASLAAAIMKQGDVKENSIGSISLPKRPGTEPGACKSAHHGRHCVCG